MLLEGLGRMVGKKIKKEGNKWKIRFVKNAIMNVQMNVIMIANAVVVMNKLKLKHYGCSFAVGHGTNCGRYLTEKLKLRYTRDAENGSSNERTLRKLLTTSNESNFVLIGITSSNRREGLTTNKNNTFWNTWKQVAPEEDSDYKLLSFDPWVHKNGKKEYRPAIDEEAQIRTAIQIICMQSFLKLKNIPYLFFNALYNGFDKPFTEECKNLLNLIDENYFYQLRSTFEECQHGFCIENNMTISNEDTHPNARGQEAWGKLLLPKVKNILGIT